MQLLSRLEEHGWGEWNIPYPQGLVPGGGWVGGSADPVLSLLQDVSTCLAALEEKAGTVLLGNSTPGPSSAQPMMASHFMPSPVVDPAMPSTSTAHLAQAVGALGGLLTQCSPAEAWLAAM